MVTKGKCRGNGGQLADYLLKGKNDRAELLEVIGTSSPDDLKKSLTEMCLSAVKSKSEAGLYHAQINLDPKEPNLTREQWLEAADILAETLGLQGQRRAIVLHQKDGRIHAHVVFERYQEGMGKNGKGILWNDNKNYKKHEKASRQMEKTFGHERTPEKPRKEQSKEPNKEHDLEQKTQLKTKAKLDHKKTLTELWQQYSDPAEFVKAAQKLGYEVAAGEDRRPFKIITPEGANLDLVRQITTAKTKDVAERLNPIRKDLWTEKEALKFAEERQQEQVNAQAKEQAAAQEAQKKAQEATKAPDKEKPKQKAEKLPEPAKNKFKALSDLAEFKTNAAATAAEKQSTKEQAKPEPQATPPIDEKANRLHQLGQFKANAPQPPQKEPDKAQERPAANDNQPAPPKLPPTANDNQKAKEPQTDKERFEAKIKAIQEREEANRREIERRAQLTEEQRRAEDKARFEAKLREMQDQERDQTRPRQRGLER